MSNCLREHGKLLVRRPTLNGPQVEIMLRCGTAVWIDIGLMLHGISLFGDYLNTLRGRPPVVAAAFAAHAAVSDCRIAARQVVHRNTLARSGIATTLTSGIVAVTGSSRQDRCASHSAAEQ